MELFIKSSVNTCIVSLNGVIKMEKTLLEENVEILRNAMGNWVHKQLILMTAAQFAAKGQKIDGNAFIKVSDTRCDLYV